MLTKTSLSLRLSLECKKFFSRQNDKCHSQQRIWTLEDTDGRYPYLFSCGLTCFVCPIDEAVNPIGNRRRPAPRQQLFLLVLTTHCAQSSVFIASFIASFSFCMHVCVCVCVCVVRSNVKQ